jgi:hypothetical protein
MREPGCSGHPGYVGYGRAQEIFRWLAAQTPAGSRFGRALSEALPRLTHRGLLILVSDFWFDDLEADLKVLGSLPQEILGVHVAAPEELEPAQLIGETRLVDAESGHEVELLIDHGVLGAYKAALANWQDRLRAQITSRLGRYLLVRSDASLSRLLLHDWRRLGLIS